MNRGSTHERRRFFFMDEGSGDMDERLVKLLLIEDDEDDYILVRDMLSEIGSPGFRLDWVDTYRDGIEAICRDEHDAYLLDYRLGEGSGLELLREAVRNGCERPIILLTGQGDYEIDIEAMRAGAADYLIKGQIRPDLLERAIRYSIERKRAEVSLRKAHDELEMRVRERTADLTAANQELRNEIAERRRVEDALGESEARYRNLVETAMDIIFTILPDMRISSLNSAFEKITGRPVSEWIGKEFTELVHPDDLEFAVEMFKETMAGKENPSGEVRVRTKWGGYRMLEFKAVAQSRMGRVEGVAGTARDITERKRDEERIAQQNEFLRTILESLSHPFYVLDASDYSIKMANSAAIPAELPSNMACCATGYSGNQVCGVSRHFCPVEEIKKTKQPLVSEHIHYDPRGGMRHIEVHGHPILNSAGEVAQVIEYTLDITERKRMEEDLRKARDELEARVRERTAELARSNEALRLEKSRLHALWELSRMDNASTEDITGFVLEQQVNLTGSKLGALGFVSEDEASVTLHVWPAEAAGPDKADGRPFHYPVEKAGAWADAVRKRKPVVLNHYMHSGVKAGFPEGFTAVYRMMSVPVFDREKIVAVALVANKDEEYNLSDVRQLTLLIDGMWRLIQQQQAERMLREAERLAAIGRALSSVAHDMKTPLIAIGGFTQMVHRHLEENSPDRSRLEIVINETRRLESMIKEMLDFSRPLELTRTREDLGRIVAESVAVVENAARERRIDVRTELDRDLSVPVDSMRMKQVIINLVMNAIQASSDGETVMVSARRNGNSAVVDVADCGCGIPPEKREDIFLPFFSTKKEGTGLGLAIVKKIVDAHRGKIRILDNSGKGVVFRILIPLNT